MNAVATHPAVTLSAAARARVLELQREQGNAELKLRIAIEGGGCSGFQYDVRLDAARGADDFVLASDGVELLVDPLSLQYLDGAEVDYVEQLAGAQFVIHNPNAKSTCGCGSSFTC